MESNNKCEYCNKSFFNSSSKKRHIKTIHQGSLENKNKSHIYCPLCEEETSWGTYDNLSKHLTEIHNVSIIEVNFTFSSKKEYNTWRNVEKLEVNYVLCRTKKKEGQTETYYICNRSNAIGYTSKCNIRTEKAGGSIKIRGVCPSRLIINSFDNGQVMVKYVKTHVGHEKDIRSQHLSNTEKDNIVKKLQMGITVDRIMEDARKLECDKLSRLNVLNRKDINYLSTKYNVEKRRHTSDMVAVALKIKEWNSNGKNYAFFFKAQGKHIDKT